MRKPLNANLKRLHTIPYGQISKLPAFGTGISISELSNKDKGRTIYLLNTALVKKQEDFDNMMKEYVKLGLFQENVTKIIMKDPTKYNKELISLIDA